MINSNMLISFSLFFFFIYFAYSSSSSSFNVTHKCSPQQTLDLLLFKQNLSSINHPYDKEDYYDLDCQDWLGSDYHPVMMNWKKNTDCCKWDGVTCNHFTGDVIGIDLSCGMLRGGGTIHPNSTLFRLPHLQTLNLAYNDFTASQFPHEILRFSNSLTHLNISHCGLTGEISWEFLHLPKLVSLDLSWNDGLQVQPYVLKNLLQNSTHLRELLISEVYIGWVLPTYLNISSSLKTLDLMGTGLQGKLPANILNLQYLEKLDLGNNYLTGPLPKVNISINIPLEWLALASTNLSREKLGSIGHLTSLSYLDLSSCGLWGSFPKSILNLTHLTSLYLEGNMLNGMLPSFLFTLPSIENVFLGSNLFSGGVPSEFFSCRSLESLSLRSNQFDGEIDQVSNLTSFIQLVNLNYLDLRWNSFIGLWDLATLLSSLPNLQGLRLSYSGLSVVNINATSYVNSNFQELGLASCKLTVFPESLRAMKKLQGLDLSHNTIQGRIPDWAQEVGGNELLYLDLSYNFITGLPKFQWDELYNLLLQSNQIQGPFPPSICSMRNLKILDISDNSFSGVIPQCLGNISSSLQYVFMPSNRIQGPFPSSICNMRKLEMLDISNNRFIGVIPQCLGNINSPLRSLSVNSNQIQGPFPQSFCNMRSLELLDISNNSFSGVIPQCLGNISPSLYYLNVKSNQLQGPFPSSICNLSGLAYLDMSNNSFDGVIPQCLGIIMSSLGVVDMRNNRFHGSMPDVYQECERLEGLILNGNQLQGEVPSSLSKCRSLKVLDLGNNRLNGTFPGWLGHLPMLQVLVLKSNKLHGPIETISTNKSLFSSMQVLDLSHNEFVGHLPRKQFQNFNAMKDVARKSSKPEYLNMSGVYYSILVVVKGVEQVFSQIFVDYTIVDLSNNNFEGEIPGIIGSLTSLIVLNLSHNHLTGQIPSVLGNLSEIESLDLSWNQLTGEIPRSLANLTFLEFLNLSQNHLKGRIPSGTQFSTFESSFRGNQDLCGLPLPKKCEHPRETQLEVDGDGNEESGFTWRVVMMGYGCGTIIGLVMGYVMLSILRPKWFNAIADAGEHMIRTRQNVKKYVYIG